MSKLGSGGGPSPAATASSAVVADTSSWVPHGSTLIAFVVGVNVLMVLIFFLFWKFFSRKEGPSNSAGADAGDDEDDSLPVASPWASRWRHEDHDLGAPPLEDVASALPVYIYSSSAGAGDEGGKLQQADECAVCIVELRDGDSARMLSRCGHRFHADCVGAWLRFHATCPLCRASVVAPAATAAVAGESRNAKDDEQAASGSPRKWRKVTGISFSVVGVLVAY